MSSGREVWRAKAALAAGATGWSQRVPQSRRPFRGVRLAPAVDSQDPRVRALAAGLVLPGGGVLGGWAAATLLGAGALWFDGRDPRGRPLDVPMVVPAPNRPRRRAGVAIQQAALEAIDVVLVEGIPVTAGLRTTFDLIRHATGIREAVASGDGCVRHGFATPDALIAYAQARPGWRGVDLVRRAVPLLDGRSESRKESEVRLIWIGSGLGIPVPQVRIGDAFGAFIARVDLFDAKAGVVGEYQGQLHRAGSRPWHDTVRARGLDGVGLEVVEFWSPDLSPEARLVRCLETGYGRAARRDPAQRTYVILPDLR